MKLNKIIIPVAVATAMVLTAGVSQAKDGHHGKKNSFIEIVLFGKDKKGPPHKKYVAPPRKKYVAPPKKKYVAPPRKVVVVKPDHHKSKGHDKKYSKRRD